MPDNTKSTSRNDKFETVANFQQSGTFNINWILQNLDAINERIENLEVQAIDLVKLNDELDKRSLIADDEFNERKKNIEDLIYKTKHELEKEKLTSSRKDRLSSKLRILHSRYDRLNMLQRDFDVNMKQKIIKYAQHIPVMQAIHANKTNYNGAFTDMLNLSPQMNRAPRAIALDILHSINFKVDVMKNKAKLDLPAIPEELLNPPEFNETWFNYNETTKRPEKPKMKYIPTFSYKKFIEKYGETIPSLSDVEKDNKLRIIRGVHIMMRDQMSEARTVYIDKVLRGLIEGTRSNDPDYAITIGTSPALYYIHLLLEKYKDWPYFEVLKQMRYNVKEDMPSCLPTLIYALCNLHVQYILGNIDDMMCVVAIDTWLHWSKTCFNQEHLDAKANHTDPFKLLHECLPNPTIPTYNYDGALTGVSQLSSTMEVWYDGEMKELHEKLKNTRPYYQAVFRSRMKSKFKNVHDLTRFKVACQIVANPGNYKKTAPVLELEKSVDPRTYEPLPYPETITEVQSEDGNYAYEVNWSVTEELEGMWQEFLSLKGKIKEHMPLRDLTHEYFERLTNKSAGRNLSIEQLMPYTKEFRKYSTQRLIQALIELQKFNIENDFMVELKQLGKCGIRMQIDRRIRLIEIVNNLIQALSLIPFLFSEALSDTIPDIASGKQVGDIRDMISQLVGTASVNDFVSSMDISGADASTQKSLGLFIFYTAMDCFEDYQKDEYFWAKTQHNVPIVDLKKNVPLETTVNCLKLFCLKSLRHIKDVNFKLIDGIFGRETLVSGLTFWSGLFHTAGQHNTVLSMLLRWCEKNWRKRFPNSDIDILRLISGDDIFARIRTMSEQEAKDFIDEMAYRLLKIGMKVSKDLSRFSGVFLQQAAHFGVNCPKPDRLSMVCSEKCESVGRSLHDQFMEVKTMLLEIAPRSYYPENIIPILRGLFNASRMVTYRWSEWLKNSEYSDKLKMLQSKYVSFGKHITHDDVGVYIIAPYVYLFHAECISSPICKIATEYGVLDAGSYLMPEGDIAEVLMRKCYNMPKNMFPELYKTLEDRQLEKMKNDYEKLKHKRPGLTDRTDPFVKQFLTLDKKMLARDGWTLSQHLSRVWKKEVLLEMRKQITRDDDEVARLQKKLQQYQDSEKISRSKRAFDALEAHGVRVRESVVFAFSARERIEQSLMEKPENDEEYKDLTINVLNRICQYDEMYKKSPNEGMYNVDFFYTENLVTPHRDFIINKECPILLGSWSGSQTSNTLFFTHSVLTKTVGGRLFFSKYDSNRFRGLRIQDVVAEGVKVYRRSIYLLDEFFDAVNVQQSVRERVRALIIDAAKFGATQFNTVLRPRLYFLLSVNPESFYNAFDKIQVWGTDTISRNFEAFRSILARDYVLTYGYLNPALKKLSVYLQAETLRMIRYGPKLVG